MFYLSYVRTCSAILKFKKRIDMGHSTVTYVACRNIFSDSSNITRKQNYLKHIIGIVC